MTIKEWNRFYTDFFKCCCCEYVCEQNQQIPLQVGFHTGKTDGLNKPKASLKFLVHLPSWRESFSVLSSLFTCGPLTHDECPPVMSSILTSHITHYVFASLWWETSRDRIGLKNFIACWEYRTGLSGQNTFISQCLWLVPRVFEYFLQHRSHLSLCPLSQTSALALVTSSHVVTSHACLVTQSVTDSQTVVTGPMRSTVWRVGRLTRSVCVFVSFK